MLPLRAPSAVLLALSFLVPQQASAQGFSDVPRNHWARQDSTWLREEGYLQGWGGKLHGSKSFSRYEMVTLLRRFLERYQADRRALDARVQRLETTVSKHEDELSRLDAELEGRESGVAAAFAAPRHRSAGAASHDELMGLAEDALRAGGDSAYASESLPAPQRSDAYERLRQRAAQRQQRARPPEPQGTAVLLVPDGARVRVLPPNSGATQVVEAGTHDIPWGTRIQVLADSAASVVYPDNAGAVLLHPEADAVFDPSGVTMRSGVGEAMQSSTGKRPRVG